MVMLACEFHTTFKENNYYRMKSSTLIPTLVLLFVTTVSALAQWDSYKFGKISNQELELQQYPNKTTAGNNIRRHVNHIPVNKK
jgi:cytochrome c-type biogenesis protein CcmH/NrfG